VIERLHPLFAESLLTQLSPVAISTVAIVMPVHIVLQWLDTAVQMYDKLLAFNEIPANDA